MAIYSGKWLMVAITQTSLGGTTAEDAELQNAEAASKPTAAD
jgi:hypothetical protein